jgi:hypothetical protein
MHIQKKLLLLLTKKKAAIILEIIIQSINCNKTTCQDLITKLFTTCFYFAFVTRRKENLLTTFLSKKKIK